MNCRFYNNRNSVHASISLAQKVMALFLALCVCLLCPPAQTYAATFVGLEDSAGHSVAITQTQAWKLTEESKKQGYVLTIKKARDSGFATCTIKSSNRTERLQTQENADCQGTVETELDAVPYRGKLMYMQAHMEVLLDAATVADMDKNQACFLAMIDGKELHPQLGPLVGREKNAGISSGFVVPEAAKTIKLALRLKGLGIATLHRLELAPRNEEDNDSSQDKPQEHKRSPVNLDFSDGLNGWQTMEAFPELTTYRTILNSKAGNKSAELRFCSGTSQAATFSQTLDAVPFRGQRIAVDADCQVPHKSIARIFVMSSDHAIDDRDGKLDALLHTQRDYSFKRIADENWKHYRVVTEVDNTAKKLEFGLVLSGKGKVGIRNVKFIPLGLAVSGNESAQELSPEQTKNILLFAKAYGYLRYFYPGTNLSTDAWNNYLLWAVHAVLTSRNEHSEEILTSVLRPIAPDLQLVKTSPEAAYRSPLGSPEFWKHTGYGADRSIFNFFCRSAIIQADNSSRADAARASEKCGPITIGDGLACLWTAQKHESPLTVLPPEIKESVGSKPEGWSPSGNDRITRFSGVIALWNAAKFFYPDRELLDSEWNDVLLSALQKAAVDPGESAFLATLQRMTPALRDDQCRIYNNRIEGFGLVSARYSPDLSWDFFNGKLIVTGIATHGLHPKTVVGKDVDVVNLNPLEQLVSLEKERVSAATPERVMHRIAQNFLLGPSQSRFLFSRPPAEENTVWDTRDIPIASSVTSEGIVSSEITEKRPLSFASLKPGTIYVDLTRISPSVLKKHMKAICSAPRVVFDCRGTLCRGNDTIFQHLFSEPPPVPKLMLPVLSGPAESNRDFAPLEFKLTCLAPKLKGKTAFLIDSRTVGKMELYLMMIEAARQGRIVGTRSAGTAGSVTLAQLPADFLLSWTATNTLKPDGSRFHGVGVVPTDEVVPTIEGISLLKDEVLERALLRLEQ